VRVDVLADDTLGLLPSSVRIVTPGNPTPIEYVASSAAPMLTPQCRAGRATSICETRTVSLTVAAETA
jgi:hypothetical protein